MLWKPLKKVWAVAQRPDPWALKVQWASPEDDCEFREWNIGTTFFAHPSELEPTQVTEI